MTAASTQQILVTGDFVLDFHIYQGQRFHYGDQSSQGVVVQPQMGGAGLVYDLLQQLQKLHKGDDCEPFHSHSSHTISDIIINTPLSPSQHAFAFLRPFSSGKKDYWRVSEAMGFGANAADENQTHEDNVDNQECDGNQQPETFDVVTISEGGMGFRQSEDWEDLPFDEARWIVLKSAEPLMSGPLWERLSLKYHDKLILVVSASDLRKTNACISKGLSWDTTLRHLFNELIDGELQALKQCQHLIVSFGSEGALWVDLSKPKSVASLIYDPGVVEGDHAISMQGTVFGLLSCLTASVSAQACNEAPDFEQACEAGLAAMKNLLLEGHGPATELARGFPA
ncbi:MAG: hypothetical protein KDA78_20940, partial [Planctomycetaceae bacterium]|nr:hypothetical protein [Planctomycetaceae bacterium]